MTKKTLVIVFLSLFITQNVIAQEVGRINLQCMGLFVCSENICVDGASINNKNFETRVDVILNSTANNKGVDVHFIELDWFGKFSVDKISDNFLTWGKQEVGKFWGQINRVEGTINVVRYTEISEKSSSGDIAYVGDCVIFEKKDKLF